MPDAITSVIFLALAATLLRWPRRHGWAT